jgi:DNA-binding NtrC family response regulator
MDGFQFAALLHEVPECWWVPIIAISGYSTHDYGARARTSSIKHYLMKPADLDYLQYLLAAELAEESVCFSMNEESSRCRDGRSFQSTDVRTPTNSAGPISTPRARELRI